MDQGRAVVGRKLGGNNLSDSCYVELLLRGLGNKEKGELIKTQVLRHTKTPYRKDVRVLVTSRTFLRKRFVWYQIVRTRDTGSFLANNFMTQVIMILKKVCLPFFVITPGLGLRVGNHLIGVRGVAVVARERLNR